MSCNLEFRMRSSRELRLDPMFSRTALSRFNMVNGVIEPAAAWGGPHHA